MTTADSAFKVLVIGGTGYIGHSLVERLLQDRWSVVGLVRSETSAASLRNLGVETKLVKGGLSNVSALISLAPEFGAIVDVSVHNFKENRAAIEAISGALAPGAVLISTTGALFYGDRPDSKAKPLLEAESYGLADKSWPDFEAAVLAGSAKGLKTCVVRPPLIYGNNGGGLGGGLRARIDRAIEAKVSAWIDDGRDGRVSTVHVDDLADLYVLILNALVSGKLPSGEIVNGASGDASHQDLARAVARAAGGVPVQATTLSEAETKPGGFAVFAGTLTNILDDTKARRIGWAPKRASAVEDLTSGSYTASRPSPKL